VQSGIGFRSKWATVSTPDGSLDHLLGGIEWVAKDDVMCPFAERAHPVITASRIILLLLIGLVAAICMLSPYRGAGTTHTGPGFRLVVPDKK
jgi:hypothetical protein